MYTARIAAFLVASAFFAASAQNKLEFEVASVKPAPPPSGDAYQEGFRAGRSSRGMVIEGRRVTIIDNSLKDLVRIAWQVKKYQVSGESWMDAQRFEITATLPANAAETDAPEMLRNLLASRFQLQTHREPKEMAVYALLAGKGGMKANPSAPEAQAPGAGALRSREQAMEKAAAELSIVKSGLSMGIGHIRGKGYTMQALADRLTVLLDRPVLDMTGLPGKYDLDVAYALHDNSDAAPPLIPALQEQLGLKVESRKSAVDVIVIDRASKTPTDN